MKFCFTFKMNKYLYNCYFDCFFLCVLFVKCFSCTGVKNFNFLLPVLRLISTNKRGMRENEKKKKSHPHALFALMITLVTSFFIFSLNSLLICIVVLLISHFLSKYFLISVILSNIYNYNIEEVIYYVSFNHIFPSFSSLFFQLATLFIFVSFFFSLVHQSGLYF